MKQDSFTKHVVKINMCKSQFLKLLQVLFSCVAIGLEYTNNKGMCDA